MTLDPWFLENLVCPKDQSSLSWDGRNLVSGGGAMYGVVDGIPIMLRTDVRQTHFTADLSLRHAVNSSTAERRASISTDESQAIHPFVQHILGATHGYMYKGVVLDDYPIPDIRIPPSSGDQWLLEIGCNWGRWCVAAARKGYRVIGIDPSLEAVVAARHVARKLGVQVRFLVADGRHLPFRSNAFDVVFSFSVLQHFSKDNVRATLRAIKRVLKPEGVSVVQMLNRSGLRSTYNQVRARCKPRDPFAVRYWGVHELEEAFESSIGPSRITVDGFFSANAQRADLPILPPHYRLVVLASEHMRKLANHVPALVRIADSVYVTSSESQHRLSETSAWTRRVQN